MYALYHFLMLPISGCIYSLIISAFEPELTAVAYIIGFAIMAPILLLSPLTEADIYRSPFLGYAISRDLELEKSSAEVSKEFRSIRKGTTYLWFGMFNMMNSIISGILPLVLICFPCFRIAARFDDAGIVFLAVAFLFLNAFFTSIGYFPSIVKMHSNELNYWQAFAIDG